MLMNPPPQFIPPLGPPKRSERQKILAAWRGVDAEPIEKSRERREKNANALVASVCKQLRMDSRLAEAEIVRVWNHLIDPRITAHAQPTGIREGTLFVTVDSSVWLADILQFHRREILARLQHSFGKKLIARISFRTG
jgi:predicted nucleic acid-binding Zn ribbon protein